ncbi:DUF6958 family protein [Rhodopirellula bahusiensis]|uniref:DUF6958 family protein n=1 Tax=Rhodopirellula bahusiensis TaxID=2014065 RepID=UPI003D655509
MFITILICASFVVATLSGCSREPAVATVKVECRSPNGEVAARLHEWKFNHIRNALFEVLADGEGMAYEELVNQVENKISPHNREAIGKIPWYVKTVVLELEARGELQRFPMTRKWVPENIRRISKDSPPAE